MGASFSSFKLCSSEREQPIGAVVLSSDSSNYNTSTRSGSAIIDQVLKPAEFWKKKKKKIVMMMMKKKKKRQSDHQPNENMVAKIRKFTLEELIMASPSRPDCFTNGGDLHVFNHSYKRVHPSSTGVLHTDLSSKATDSFPLEKRERDIHEEAEVLESVDSLISTSQIGKLKKKVSFKLPEEADIIVFY